MPYLRAIRLSTACFSISVCTYRNPARASSTCGVTVVGVRVVVVGVTRPSRPVRGLPLHQLCTYRNPARASSTFCTFRVVRFRWWRWFGWLVFFVYFLYFFGLYLQFVITYVCA